MKMSGEEGKKDGGGGTNTPLPLSARALLSRQRISGVMSGPGRLPSIRPARDLSLGATPKLNLNAKLGKRTFTPTIPARRVKEEPKEQDSSAKESTSHKGRRDSSRGEGRGRGRGRGRGGRGRHEIVASQSVFSMGPAEKGKSGNSGPSVSFSGGERRESSKGSRTIVKKEKNTDFNGDESQRILKMLETEDDDIDDEGIEYGMAPVSIPLANYSLKIKELEEKKSLPVKEEPMDIDQDELLDKKPFKQKPVPTRSEIKTEPDKPTCTQLFKINDESNEEKVIFIQLPDKLPIKPQDKPTTNGVTPLQNDKANPKEQSSLTLQDVSEGYIGRLQIRKSGKTQFVLGGVSLDVAMGTPCSFLQELVTVHTEENRSDLTNLGQVNHRIICTPDFEKLLNS